VALARISHQLSTAATDLAATGRESRSQLRHFATRAGEKRGLGQMEAGRLLGWIGQYMANVLQRECT
jgi:hypothetical protein